MDEVIFEVQGTGNLEICLDRLVDKRIWRIDRRSGTRAMLLDPEGTAASASSAAC